MSKLLAVFLLFCSCSVVAQPSFIPNIGQWDAGFKYKMEYSYGALFFDRNSVTYAFMNKADLMRLHDYEMHKEAAEPITEAFLKAAPAINAYAYKIVFEGANIEQIIPDGKKHTYHNYFSGSDSRQWKSRVPLYESLSYNELYKGIQLKYYQQGGQLKYDLIVAPKADVTKVRLRYEGIEPVLNDRGALLLDLGFEIVTEQAPYCYQIIDGKKTEVASGYTLENGVVGFAFPQGYNKNHPLIIDPAVIFKSYSGSTAYTTGYTSGHDNNGRLHVTGKVLGTGLPTTMGAFQMTYSGNNGTAGDIGVSVYNIDGTQQDYVTYLGGSGWEAPLHTRVNNNNDLILLGTTGSGNFPATAGGFDNAPPGGANPSKSFIVIFNAAGSQLLASTFVGGNGGSIETMELDLNENIIAGGRGSQFPYNFPANVYQTTSAGGSDNALIKFNPDLTQMIAATYFGGTGTDLFKDFVYNKITDEVITLSMVTTGNGMATTPGVFSNTGDDWICRFNSDFTQALAVARHMQTNQADIDGSGNIYIMGKGDPPASPGVYTHNSGKGFVKKLNADLSAELLAAQIGGSNIDAPLNMQVSDCGYVCLFSGTNVLFGPFTTDADFTANAFQTTSGSYYYEVMEPDFAAQAFATMLGSNESDHVHARCKNNSGKTQTQYWGTCTESPNWWQTPGCAQSTGPAAGGFDMAGMKFDVGFSLGSGGGANISLLPNDTICLGDTLFFAGLASPTATILWNFGDGTQSNQSNPTHLFTSPGVYHVHYSLTDPQGCVPEASDSVNIYVLQPDNITVTPGDTVVCNAKTPLNIKVTGGKTYLWSPENAVNDPTGSSIHLNNDGTYHLTVTVTHNGGCISTHDINISQYNIRAEAGPDHVIVPGKSVTLDGSESYGASVFWDSHPTVADVNNLTPAVTPSVTTWYYINAEGGEHCKARDSALVTVVGLGLPNAFSPNGDGLNDIFKLITNDEDNVKVKIDIYNRFGQRVFHTPNVKKGWDGTFHGEPCDLGVYFYHITAKVGDTEYEFKGDLSLMR